ncbi:MAG: hypothetical protein ABIO70_17530 [Pseudomonadota bacterium]
MNPGSTAMDSGRVYGDAGEIHWEAWASPLPPAEVAAGSARALGQEGVLQSDGCRLWRVEGADTTRVLVVGDTGTFPHLHTIPPSDTQAIAAFSQRHHR